MIYISGKLPQNHFYLALSGGVDSMAVMDFLRKGRHEFTAAYFNHGTEHGAKSEIFVREYCRSIGQRLVVGTNDLVKLDRQSWEEYWRDARYGFFNKICGIDPETGDQHPDGQSSQLITCHHLDDCIETWIFTSLHGDPKLIPYKNGSVVRPFLATKMEFFKYWCVKYNVPWIDDPSNLDTKYARNRIRHLIVPQALLINPGIAKVIRKKLNARKEQ